MLISIRIHCNKKKLFCKCFPQRFLFTKNLLLFIFCANIVGNSNPWQPPRRACRIITKNTAHTTDTIQKKEDALLNKTFNVFSVIALILCIVGALNWMAIGIFGFNFVNLISFGMMWLEKLIYILVGVAGLFMIVWLCVSRFRMVENCQCESKHSYGNYERRSYNS